MAVSLFRLAVTASTSTRARPNVKKYMYPLAYSQITGAASNILVIPRSKFTSDTGGTVSIMRALASNGYYLLEINGVVQESGAYTFSIAANSYIQKVTVSGITSNLFNASTPIALVVNNFAPLSTTTVKA